MKRIGKPAKGKAVAVKVGGKKRSVGQAGVTPKPGTAKGDATAQDLRRFRNVKIRHVLTT
jgi:hypothetical protein